MDRTIYCFRWFGGLQIGDYCSISSGVQIYTHDTVRWATSGGNIDPEHAPVRIGNRCYIGPNVVVSKGSQLVMDA